MVLKHNDYEVLALAREGNEAALQLLFEKYSRLIYKKIYKFNLQAQKDDYYQEGLMLLHKSILKFDATYSKSFTRYFELNLDRRFISEVSKRVRRQQIMEEHIEYIFDVNTPNSQGDEYFYLYLDEISKILTKNENLVYTLRELNNYSISYIKEKHGLTERVIYNSLYRAKKKIKSHFAN